MININASIIPKRARLRIDQPSARAVNRLIEVSSRKSILSGNNETEPIFFATINSTKKYVRFNKATTIAMRLKVGTKFLGTESF